MRVFVALEPPARIRDAVEAAVAPLRGRYRDLRWTRPEGRHVTLAFLGEVDDGRSDAVQAAVAAGLGAAGVGPLELSLGAPGTFGGRVLWLGIDARPDGAVAAAGAAVQEAVVAAGLPCDRKEVHPHVTLARPRGRGRLPRGLLDEVGAVDGRWTAADAVILRSHLGSGGSRYEALATVPL